MRRRSAPPLGQKFWGCGEIVAFTGPIIDGDAGMRGRRAVPLKSIALWDSLLFTRHVVERTISIDEVDSWGCIVFLSARS
jgi:hypothetical protein